MQHLDLRHLLNSRAKHQAQFCLLTVLGQSKISSENGDNKLCATFAAKLGGRLYLIGSKIARPSTRCDIADIPSMVWVFHIWMFQLEFSVQPPSLKGLELRCGGNAYSFPQPGFRDQLEKD